MSGISNILNAQKTAASRIRVRIFVKFTAIISCCLIVIFSLLGGVLINLQKHALFEEKEKSARTLTKQVADISATPIKTLALFVLDENAAKLQASPDIMSVIVYDTAGSKLNPSSGIEKAAIRVPRKYWLEEEHECVYVSTTGQQEIVGKVVILFSLESIYQEVEQIRFTFGMVMIIAVLLVGAITAVMLLIIVTKPLQTLTSVAQQLSAGDFNISLTPSAQDEIGFLSATFVEMSRKLHDSFKTIQEYNISLQREIEERERMQQILIKERNLLQTLIDHLPDRIYVKDAKSHFLLANIASIQSLKVQSLEELVGKTDFDLLPRDLAETCYADEQLLMASQQVVIDREEANIDLETGETIWFLTTKVPFQDSQGRVAGIVGLSRDITERKRAEGELKKYRNHLEDLVNERTIELQTTNEHLQQEIMKRRQAEQTLLEHNRELALFNSFTELLQKCTTEPETYPVLTGISRDLLPQKSGYLCLCDPSGTKLNIVDYWGSPPQAMSFHPDDCRVFYQLSQNGQQTQRDGVWCLAQSIFPNDRHLCLPIRASDDILGMLCLHVSQETLCPLEETNEPGLCSMHAILTRIIEQYALFLINLRLRETLHLEAIHDPLTGLYNRRYMEEALDREASRANRHHAVVGLIMLDIDHFKTLNDTYGHDAGDIILRELGEVLRHSIRREDVACRYGGEEFLLILPDTSLKNTQKRADELCAKVRTLRFRHYEKSLSITVSIGVAALSKHTTDIKQALNAADKALYQAKAAGRNQVKAAF